MRTCLNGPVFPLRLCFPRSPLFSPHIPTPPLTSCPPFPSICVLLGAPPPFTFPSLASCLDRVYLYKKC